MDHTVNRTISSIASNILLAFFSLFVNGFGIYLTILADVGAAPWDVFNLGLSHTFHILYGNASITVAFIILFIDILMNEPIGIAMFIDAVTVGKSVDLFNALAFIPKPKTLFGSGLFIFIGLIVIGYTQYMYMAASLGCGPRDTLLVGLKKRIKKVPIGLISICLLSVVTLIGYLLGGPVGIGTLLCAFFAGPIMQICFTVRGFDETKIRHQSIGETLSVLLRKKENTLPL